MKHYILWIGVALAIGGVLAVIQHPIEVALSDATQSQAYRDGYTIERNKVATLSPNDLAQLQQSGGQWSAAGMCTLFAGLEHVRSEDMNDWARGCTDALHEKGIK